MMRPFVVVGSMLLPASVAMGTAAGREIDGGRLGSLPLVLSEDRLARLVFLFSDRTGST